MANIEQYTSKVDKLTPSEIGSQAFEIEGRHIGADYQSAGNYIGGGIQAIGKPIQEAEDQADIANLSKAASQTFLEQTAAWNKSASEADPANVDASGLQEKFLAGFDEAADKLQGLAKTDKGREFALRWADANRQHFTMKTQADVGTITARGVTSNIDQTNNNYSQAAYLDPTGRDDIIAMADASMEANIRQHAGSLTPEQVSQIREQYANNGRKLIAVSAAKGAAERNPEQFKAELASGKWGNYFNGEEAHALDTYADHVIKANEAGSRANDIKVRRQQDENIGNELNSLDMAQPRDAGGNVTIQPDFFNRLSQIAQMDGAGRHPAELRAMSDWAQRELKEHAKGDIVSDPDVRDDFSRRMSLDTNDPHRLSLTEVYNARAEGDLSAKDFAFYKSAVTSLSKDPGLMADNKKLNQLLTSLKPSFGGTNLLGLVDPAAKARYGQFQQFAEDQFSRADPATRAQMLDPHNANYIGRQAIPFITSKKGSAGTAAVPSIKNAADWKALKPGQSYIDPNGKLRTR